MNTAEFDTRLRHQQSVTGVETPPPAPSGIPITVLSTDAELCEAIRAAAAPQHAVFVAATMEEASEFGAAGRCGILVTDQALNQQNLVRMSRQMRTHDPAAITIAVGSRGDDHALIGLLSSAVVERFMLKPVTPALARLVLRSASSEYQSLRSRKRRQAATEAEPVEDASASEPTRIAAKVIPLARPESVPEPSAPAPSAVEIRAPHAAPAVIESAPTTDAGHAASRMPPKSFIPWIAAAVAALVVGVAVWWTMQQRMPQIDPRQVIASNLDAAARAFAAGHYADPPESSALHHYGTVLALDPSNAAARQGVGQVADRMIEGVKLGIVEGRLAEAGIALERVRRIDPNNRRLPLLEDQLRKQQENQLALLRTREAPPAPVVAAAAPKPARAAPAKRAPAVEPAPVKPAPVTESVPVEAKSQTLAARTIDPDDPLALGPPAPVRVQTPAVTPQAAGAVAAAAATVAAVQPPAGKKEAAGSAVPAPVVADPRLIKVIEPEYPEEARMRNLEGWVDMVLAVDAAGVVTDARVEGGKNGRMFDRAALVAVRKWRYEPRTLPESTATQPVRVRVHFKLEE